MPQVGMSEDLKAEIARVRLNPPHPGATKIHAALEKLHAQGKLGEPVPSLRAIGRCLETVRDMPPEEKRVYWFVYWPESFVRGDLPWEAAPSVLELLREWGTHPRPPVRQAYWYWRLRQVAGPGVGVLRAAMALSSAIPESPGFEEAARWAEEGLIHPGAPLPELVISAPDEALMKALAEAFETAGKTK